jgi:hypothetical protein
MRTWAHWTGKTRGPTNVRNQRLLRAVGSSYRTDPSPLPSASRRSDPRPEAIMRIATVTPVDKDPLPLTLRILYVLSAMVWL